MANDSAWQVSLVERARQIVAQAAGGADLPAVAPPTRARLAAMIDHTVLKPEAPPDAIDRACDEAREHCFASVCANPCYVARCAHRLAGSGVAVCTVAGFPLGANLSRVKAFEAQQAIAQGATEVDMVIAVGALKGGDYGAVRDDIRAVADVCHGGGAVCKAIIEAALLTDEEKVLACLLIAEAGADFCKTSTGFGPGGAKAEDVRLMRAAVGLDMGVKAAGGIRTYAAAAEMVRAGATRIGASAGPQILADAPDAP